MIQQIVRVDVDTQHGFCHPKGGLYVQGAEAVLPVVSRLNAQAQALGHVLLGSVDTHESYSKEFKENGGVWPVHCVKGTWDWLKVPETLPKRFLILAAARYERPLERDDVALYFEKDLYSLFDNLNADPIVRRLGEQGAAFQVYGVATDYCVKAAALGIRERCPNSLVQLVRDAIAPVNREGGEQAIAEMKAKGIELVDSADVL
ncbi:MAG TPA: isochorismatase family protein [Myxococcales bacterium]|jgi:nicotinamidase/pyrazinamidase